MKIKQVESIPLVRNLESVFEGGTYRITSRNTIVTRVELDNGVVGETFGGDEDQYQLDVCRVVNSIYRPLIVGGDVRDCGSALGEDVGNPSEPEQPWYSQPRSR